MLKPKAVTLRVNLWKLFYGITSRTAIPSFGLNFLVNYKLDKKVLLLCGFEKFDIFFVRVDILEKLFIKILNKTKQGKFKIDADMMNLLGCTKENFYKLMKLMNYKRHKEKDTYLLGEDIGFTFRSLSNPKSINQPDTYGGNFWLNPNCGTPNRDNDYCGVHRNSGIMNHWFYLLAEGSSNTDEVNDNGDAFNIAGISTKKY